MDTCSRTRLCTFAAALLACCAPWSSPSLAADAETLAFAQQVESALPPADQAWVVSEGAAVSAWSPISAATIGQRVSARFATRKYSAQTIEAIVSAVLVEVEQDQARDLQRIKAAIEANNRLKELLREAAEQIRDATCTEDLSQQLNLALQQKLQRVQEATSQATAISKKYHDQLKGIIANIRG